MLRRPQVKTAGSLLGTSLYVEPLGSLTGALEKGWFTLLYGLDYSNILAQKLCFAAQLPSVEGGLECKSVVVDAGNAFDLYHIAHLASKHGINPRSILRGIIIARAFNCHQLVDLLIHDLPNIIDEYRTGLVAVLDPALCFADSGLKAEAQKKLVKTVADALSDTAHQAKVVVVATSTDDTPLTKFLLRSTDVAVRFRKTSSKIQASVVRHPFTIRKAITIEKGKRVGEDG